MADTICASQGPHNPRLRLDLLDKQQLAASKSTGTTRASHAHLGVSAQGGAQLIIDAAQAHWHLDLLGRMSVMYTSVPSRTRADPAEPQRQLAMDLEKFQAYNNKVRPLPSIQHRWNPQG